MINLKTLYRNALLWMKNLYASIRNGQEYRQWKHFLAQNLNTEKYQFLKLKETLSYAYENTIYYKKIFDELQCNLLELNKIKDLEQFPLINKDIVRKNYNDMIVQHYPKRNSFFVSTSGSTGEAMKFVQSK